MLPDYDYHSRQQSCVNHVFLVPVCFVAGGLFLYPLTFCPVWQKHGKIHYEKMKNNVTYVYICIYSTLNVTISCLKDYQTLFLEHD